MNSDVFETWFRNIRPELAKRSVIVMDNDSFHSRRIDKSPTPATKKGEIQGWLNRHGIAFTEDMIKAELLTLVNINKPTERYVIDEMAASKEHYVLRLPPYHCEFKPIELILAQIKGEVARNNATFKIADVKQSFYEALQNVTAHNWQKAIEHVKKVESKIWETDRIMEITVEHRNESLKPYSYAQVVMLSGLFKSWKQPVFYDFDFQLSPHHLESYGNL
ncbi:uncharacterized protein [Diabrotica undecimpunctata]|uniref:uncharacterized protein n=1 Tax=Diabrotica undecimpunctata TaxID=50387 RepID=UPI003B6403C2